MPKVQYLGPYDRREVNAADLGREAPPAPETPEGETPQTPEPEILVWEKDGEFVELSDGEWLTLRTITGGSSWALQEESAAIDESSGQPDQAPSPPYESQDVGNQPPG
jgi:hypothetical protein